MRLHGRRARVVGGGALGRASALRFAQEGAGVAVLDLAQAAALETVRLVAEAGGRAVAVTADVRSEDEVAPAVAAAVEALGGLDLLLNNAGVMPHQDVSFLGADPALWADIFGINLLGTALVSKHAVPHLLAHGPGSALVNTGSFLSVLGCSIPQDAYTASKGAVDALTRSMAVQLGPRGVRVNALAPGPVLTPHVEVFFPDDEARAVRLARVPLGRFRRPEDAAALACFLGSDDASWITGQTVVLDGGIFVAYL